MADKIKIWRDSRERGYWDFAPYSHIVVEDKKLDKGDYCLADYPDELCVERKKDVFEAISNTSPRQIERFSKAIERLMTVKIPVLLISGKFTDFYSKMMFTKLSPNATPLYLMDYQLRGLQVMYVEGRGMWFCANLITKFAKLKGII